MRNHSKSFSRRLRLSWRAAVSIVIAMTVMTEIRHVDAFATQRTAPNHLYTRSKLFMTSEPDASESSAPSTDQTLSARSAINWIKSESLESLLPKQDAMAIIEELLSPDNRGLIDDSEQAVKENWQKLQQKLQQEQRTVAQILGPDTKQRLLTSIQTLEGYDADAVRTFLSSEAVNKLLAQLLYDGIYNFFQSVDVFGNLIGNLPVIGPIRNQIRDQAKKNVDRTVGPLIQQFLRSYGKVAVVRAADFVLSPANQKVFGQANAKLASSVLDRPVQSLVPSSEITDQWRVELYDYFRSVKPEDVEQYVDFVYQLLGDKAVDDVVNNVDDIIDASPTLEKTIDRIWTQAVKAGGP